MKTHDSLRPTIGNPSWFWRAAAALLALVALLASIGLARLAWPVAQTPVANPNAPIGSSGSAYDGSAYVEYLLRSEPIETTPSLRRNPNIPISGTGSAYDGGSYGTVPSAVPNSSMPIKTTPAARRNPNIPISGTGSAYDGGSYQTVPASSQP